MKKTIYLLAMSGIFVACNPSNIKEKEEAKIVREPSKQNKNLTAEQLLLEQENFLSETGFKKRFFFEANGKSWKDVDAFYQEAIQTYAGDAHLDVLKVSLVAALAGQPHTNLRLAYDGTEATKEKIVYYASEIKAMQMHESPVALYFIKELQKFWTNAQVKEYAQLATTWIAESDYKEWEKRINELSNATQLNQGEKAELEALNVIVLSFDAIKNIANS